MSNLLDETDRKVLKELEKDGRASIADISRAVGVQRDVVKYRIDRMFEKGIIKSIVPICDTGKLGHPIYSWVNFQLQQVDEGTEKRFQSYMRSHHNVIYLCKVTGHYHYAFTIAAKDIVDFDRIVREILSAFPQLVKSYNTSLLIDEMQYDTFYRLIPQA